MIDSCFRPMARKAVSKLLNGGSSSLPSGTSTMPVFVWPPKPAAFMKRCSRSRPRRRPTSAKKTLQETASASSMPASFPWPDGTQSPKWRPSIGSSPLQT